MYGVYSRESKRMKEYTTFPNSAVQLFKPKDLSILAGMYLSAYSDRSSGDIIKTDITQKQLSELTGVDYEYIRKRFMPRLKESGFCDIESRQIDYTTKRNTYYLPNPNINLRIIRSELFSDISLSPDEKGVLIGLYCNCVNGTYSFDLSDVQMSERLGISRGTYLKYKKSLSEKGIICTGEFLSYLLHPEHLDAQLLVCPHLGYDFIGYKRKHSLFRPYKIFLSEPMAEFV